MWTYCLNRTGDTYVRAKGPMPETQHNVSSAAAGALPLLSLLRCTPPLHPNEKSQQH